MKIVFLDIDGVLNHAGTPTLSEKCLDQARRIATETDAKFVLSSSWKEVFTKAEYYNENDRKLVVRLMKHEGLEFLGWTPDIAPDNRELEIQAWLDEYNETIDSFVIIDDLDYDFLELFPGNFVKTAGFWGQGLTEHHANRAIEILNLGGEQS